MRLKVCITLTLACIGCSHYTRQVSYQASYVEPVIDTRYAEAWLLTKSLPCVGNNETFNFAFQIWDKTRSPEAYLALVTSSCTAMNACVQNTGVGLDGGCKAHYAWRMEQWDKLPIWMQQDIEIGRKEMIRRAR